MTMWVSMWRRASLHQPVTQRSRLQAQWYAHLTTSFSRKISADSALGRMTSLTTR